MSKGGYNKLLVKLQEANAEILSLRSRLMERGDAMAKAPDSMPVEPSPARGKIREFWTSTPAWGVIGALIAMAASSSPYAFECVYVLCWIVLCFEFIRIKIVPIKRGRYLINLVFAVATAMAFWLGWPHFPKPPAMPTLDQQWDSFGKRFPWLSHPNSSSGGTDGTVPPGNSQKGTGDTLRQRTIAMADDLYDWTYAEEGPINSWKQQALAQAFLDSMKKHQNGPADFQQRFGASLQQAAQRFSFFYWPQVITLQDELRYAGVDTEPLSRAEASGDPAREIALAMSVLAERIGKRGPFLREITPLQMKMLSQQLDLRNVEVYAYLSDVNSRQVANMLRHGFGSIKGVTVNEKVLPLSSALTAKRQGIWLIYPSADLTTELNGFIPAFDECQLQNKWEVRFMKQPPSILKIEVWPETPGWKPMPGPNLTQP